MVESSIAMTGDLHHTLGRPLLQSNGEGPARTLKKKEAKLFLQGPGNIGPDQIPGGSMSFTAHAVHRVTVVETRFLSQFYRGIY